MFFKWDSEAVRDVDLSLERGPKQHADNTPAAVLRYSIVVVNHAQEHQWVHHDSARSRWHFGVAKVSCQRHELILDGPPAAKESVDGNKAACDGTLNLWFEKD